MPPLHTVLNCSIFFLHLPLNNMWAKIYVIRRLIDWLIGFNGTLIANRQYCACEKYSTVNMPQLRSEINEKVDNVRYSCDPRSGNEVAPLGERSTMSYSPKHIELMQRRCGITLLVGDRNGQRSGVNCHDLLVLDHGAFERLSHVDVLQRHWNGNTTIHNSCVSLT